MSNVAQLVTAVRKPQFSYPFTTGSLAQSTTGTLVNTGVSGLNRRYMGYQGSVYALVATLSGTLAGGTVTVTPVVDGTPQPNWVLVLSTPGVTGGVLAQDARKTSFNQGSTLQFLYTTDTFSVAGQGLEVEVQVMFESVDL